VCCGSRSRSCHADPRHPLQLGLDGGDRVVAVGLNNVRGAGRGVDIEPHCGRSATELHSALHGRQQRSNPDLQICRHAGTSMTMAPRDEKQL
jgi:hypothetical protein